MALNANNVITFIFKDTTFLSSLLLRNVLAMMRKGEEPVLELETKRDSGHILEPRIATSASLAYLPDSLFPMCLGLLLFHSLSSSVKIQTLHVYFSGLL